MRFCSPSEERPSLSNPLAHCSVIWQKSKWHYRDHFARQLSSKHPYLVITIITIITQGSTLPPIRDGNCIIRKTFWYWGDGPHRKVLINSIIRLKSFLQFNGNVNACTGWGIQLAHPILCFRDNKKSDMGPETTICVVGPSCWSANLLMWFRYLVVPFVVSLVWNVAICWFGHTHRINILDGGPILLTTICDIAQDVDSWIYKNQQSLSTLCKS